MTTQPLSELTLTRPWHYWGIAILGVPDADLPELGREAVVAEGESALVIAVRHAQDIEGERFEGDWDWATAAFHIRSLVHSDVVTRPVVCDVVLPTVDERLSLGDADGEIVLPCPSTRTRVIVSTDNIDRTGLENVWVDLVPADSGQPE